MAEEPTRITVSRDALRADLAEMELRLRVYFDSQLVHKADAGMVAELALRVDGLDRGDFTDVHRRALTDFVEGVTQQRIDRGWTARERLLGVVSIAIAVLAFGLSVYTGLKSAHSAGAPPTTQEVGP